MTLTQQRFCFVLKNYTCSIERRFCKTTDTQRSTLLNIIKLHGSSSSIFSPLFGGFMVTVPAIFAK